MGLCRRLALTAVLALQGCSSSPPDTRPTFVILDQNFRLDIPPGFCLPNKQQAMGFAGLQARNEDKVMMITMLDCGENDRLASPRNYISVMTWSDPEKMKATPQEVFSDFKPQMDQDAFLALMRSAKRFPDLKKDLEKAPGRPLGEYGVDMPDARDERCRFSGYIYGPLPLKPETSRPIVSCRASVGGRLILVFHHADAKGDLVEMARRVHRLVGSIEAVEGAN